MAAGKIGAILTPAQGNVLPADVAWCADNGCGPGKRGIAAGYPGDEAWLAWLTQLAPHAHRCLFAVAPDIVGDAVGTLERSAPFLPLIRGLGFPAALAAQDGLEALDVPWDTFDVLFIGGSTEWKLGAACGQLAREAKTRGKHVHMGRVNSRIRVIYAQYLEVDSADGTFISFGPDKNLPRMLRWLRESEAQTALDFGKVS